MHPSLFCFILSAAVKKGAYTVDAEPVSEDEDEAMLSPRSASASEGEEASDASPPSDDFEYHSDEEMKPTAAKKGKKSKA